MIISRTPFRISFFGGGSDYPDWYENNNGQVLSTTINKYCYINIRYLPNFFNYNYRIRYYKTEEANKISDIEHPVVREALKYYSIKDGIELVHNADLPARSGLGSSSTFTVGLINTLHALKKEIATKRMLASSAINLEQNIIKENVGSQDQVAAAFGGFNNIKFTKNNFQVNQLPLSKNRIKELEGNLMLFFTGFQRSASNIAAKQIKSIKQNKIDLSNSVSLVDEGIDILVKDKKIDDFGKLLDEQWIIKKNYSDDVTNENINKIYKTAINAGAIGGKLLGAGGGGFILFYVKKKYQISVRKSLKNLLYVPFEFESNGSQIVYFSNQ
tara:strand:+ start:3134 stop:4117 length:984 start_codon:yes stop_codon:yes gene_type:complete